MEKNAFILSGVVFILLVVWTRGITKLQWYFAGILLIPASVLVFPSGELTYPRIAVYTLFFVTLFQKGVGASFKTFPLRIPLIILFICLLLVGLADDRLSLGNKIYRPVSYFLITFPMVFLTYFYVKTPDDARKLYVYITRLFILFGVYGLINYLVQYNDYNAFFVKFTGVRDFANAYTISGESRFRVASLSWHAIFYGFLLQTVILMMIYLFTADRKYSRNILHYGLFVLMIINLFLVNSRTPLFAVVPGIIVYVVFSVKFSRQVLIFFATIIIGFGALAILPQANKLLEKSMAVLSGSKKEKEDGSSVEMRQRQLNASIQVFDQSPVFGNGFRYIQENLHYNSDGNKKKKADAFAGFESYAFLLLIEHGLVGMFGNIVLILTLVFWLIAQHPKVNKLGRRTVFFSLAITLSFLVFIFGTGDLGSFIFFMSVMGINIRLIKLCNKENEITIDLDEFRRLNESDNYNVNNNGLDKNNPNFILGQ